MQFNSSYNIFFSYSRKDYALAVRIYDDLRRSGLQIWRDVVSCPYGIDFSKEIKNKITEYDGFILLDSCNSRQSRWVIEEYRLFRELRTSYPTKTLAICRLHDMELINTQPVFFEGHDLIKYFDFSGLKLYDNETKYRDAIYYLCEYWGVQYKANYVEPTEKDFEDEISQVNIKDEDRRVLLSDFSNILLRSLQLFPSTEQRIKVLIKDCEYLGIKAASPWLQLGIIQDSNQKWVKAFDTFEKASTIFPFDPRSWRGLGASCIRLELFSDALDAFYRALDLTEKISDLRLPELNEIEELNNYSRTTHLQFIDDIRLHIAFIYQKLNKWLSALEWYSVVYESKLSHNQTYPELFIGLSNCYEAVGNSYKRKDILEEGISYFPGDALLHCEMGRLYFETHQFELAIKCSEFIIEREYDLIKSYSELLILLKITSNKVAFNYYFKKAGQFIPQTSLEHYYYGHILYMANEFRTAKKHFKQYQGEQLTYREIWRILQPYIY